MSNTPHLVLLNFTTFYGLHLVNAAHAREMLVTVVGPPERFERYPETPAAADYAIVCDLHDTPAALGHLDDAHQHTPFSGVFVNFDAEVELAARLAERLDLPWNTVAAAQRVHTSG